MRDRTLLSLLLLGGVGIALWSYPLNRAWMAGALAAMPWRSGGSAGSALPATSPLAVAHLSAVDRMGVADEFDYSLRWQLPLHLLREPSRNVRIDLAEERDLGNRTASPVVHSEHDRWGIAFGAIGLERHGELLQGSHRSRQFKGFAWALGPFYWLLNERRHARFDAQALVSGLLVGLVGVIGVVVWSAWRLPD